MRRAATLSLLGAVVPLVLVLSACGAGGLILDQNSARDVATLGQASNQAMVGMFQANFSPLTLASAAGGARLAPQASCQSTSPTIPVDADGDGIPASITTTWSCTQAQDGYDLTGSASVQDNDDGDAGSGFQAGVDQVHLALGSGAKALAMDVDAGLAVDTSASPFTLDASYDLLLSAGGHTAGLSLAGHPTYTPDQPADPLAGGTFTLGGSVTYSVDTKTYTLSRSSSGLVYDASCAGGFVGGSVHYADSRGNTVGITYNACQDVTLTFNGAAL